MNRRPPDSPPTIAEALRQAAARLAPLHGSARLDAEVLLAQVLRRGRSYLFAWPERVLSAEEAAAFEAQLGHRENGVPVAYLVGRQEFWSLSLQVTADTLIPRPETERLVELALERIPPERPCRVADLGTGSGAIALAIAHERPDCRVVATDRSAAALAVAEANAKALGIGNVRFRQGEWFTPLAGERYEFIISNPPYVAEGDPHLTQGDVRFEPPGALAAGTDGLDAIRQLAAGVAAHLAKHGWLLLEHGYDQGAAVRALLEAQGYREVSTYRDDAGVDRVTVGSLRGA
jgi:release factor glutamine methyltransferase